MAGLCLAAAPASATVPEEGTNEAKEAVQEGRTLAAESAPTTGTGADPLVADLLDPNDDLTDLADARNEAAQHAPRTGTAADAVVNDALTPEGDPTVDTAAVRDAARYAIGTAAATVRRVQGLVPNDPVQLVGDQIEPIAGAAASVLADSDAYAVEEAAPATAEATAVSPDIRQGMIVAGASAAAAAALVALWFAGSSGAAATSGAGAATGEMRRLLPFASPLFTRFEKDTVLGHPKREALYALILQDPGVSLQSLCDSTGLSRTAVTHHLRLLEMQHLIVSKRMGRSRHYYENGGRFGRDQKDAYAVLHNGRSKDVARFVRDHPGAIQKALCDALGIQPSIAHWHLRRLQEAQLVEAVRHGRTVSYFPGPSLKSLDRPAVPSQPAEAIAQPMPLPQPAAMVMPMMRAFPS
ncbi:MAG: winged helix-turn-helix transcriptional regulator [Candidatus Thermoplasmatota archaeon]